MEDIIFKNIFPIIGGLGLFIFGMKIMSESLQKLAGTKLKTFLSAITKNRFFGILTGTFVTSIIQSSSATTVMIVSFVNAGLINLSQAISVIMGANIGTTATAWLVSFFGFKVDITLYALPAAFLGLTLIFINKEKAKSTGEAIIGFAILFIGLCYLKSGVPNIKENIDQIQFLSYISNNGYLSVLLFVLIGTALTIIVQSSSATMAITITLAVNGWISFEIAAAMCLGENIGTTITAILASLPAGRDAKRAAISHTTFNLIGVIWMLIVFYPFLKLIDLIIPGTTDNRESIAFHLSMFHSAFNIANTFLLMWFIKYIEKFVRWVIKDKKTTKEETERHLQYINPGIISPATLGIYETRKEIYRMGNVVIDIFEETMELLKDPHNVELIKKIKEKENQTDVLQKDVTIFLSRLLTLPDTQKKTNRARKYFYLVSYLERIADKCESISRIINRKIDEKQIFDEESRKNIIEYSDIIHENLIKIVPLLDVGRKVPYNKKQLLTEFSQIEKSINDKRDELVDRNIHLIDEGVNTPVKGLLIYNILENLERIGDHIFGIAKVLANVK